MDKNSKAWLILIVAGLLEIVWATAMDYSDEFRNIPYDIIVVVFLALSMYLLSKALNYGLPIGVSYSVWTGIGAIGTFAVSTLLGNENATPLRILFISLIVIGIVGLQMTAQNKNEEENTNGV